MVRRLFAPRAFLLALPLLLFLALTAQAGTLAPLNPAFVDYLAARAEGKLAGAVSSVLPRGGRIPSPVDLSHLAGKSYFEGLSKADLPEAYDLRTLGFVTPVRDQSPYGSCWTFAALASLESSALRAGVVSPDYAEMHLGYFGAVDQSGALPGFDDYAADTPLDELMDAGGDDFQAVALLARGTGAVDEADAPYGQVPGAALPLSRRLSQVYNFYYDLDTRYQKASVDNIKGVLQTYGAVSVGVYADDNMGGNVSEDPYWNGTHNAYYVPAGSGQSSNHAVTIVGWDDAYSASNFNSPPAGDGAWIVKNSWGPAFGDGGYFYLSYYDSVLDTGAAYVGDVVDSSERIYQYDPLGWVLSYSPVTEGNETAWFAALFTAGVTGASPESAAVANDELQSVAFYAGGVGNEYEVYVYAGGTGAPRSGALVAQQAGTLALPGFHTVALENPVVIEAGTRFAVVVRLKTPGYAFPVAIEAMSEGYSDKAEANVGETFVSADGTTWADATTIDPANPTSSVCLKAFSRATADDPTPLPSSGGGGGCNLGGSGVLFALLPLVLVFRSRR